MKKLITVLFILFAAAGVATVAIAAAALREPLDPPLALDLPPGRLEAVPLAGPVEQGAQPRFCGNSGTMAIMLSGVSVPEFRDVHGIGAIRLVKVDFSGQAASILSVPRALFADTSGLDLGVDEASLTVAYRLARDAAQGNNPDVINRKATQDLAQVLLDDFGYLPDKYITVDPEPFVDLVDRLGGIDIHLDDPVDGTLEDMGYFPAGDLHMGGEQALSFLRIIDDAADPDDNLWDKFARQMKIALAICRAMVAPENWDQVPGLIRDARQLVVTDLSVDQAMDLACMVKEVGEAALFEEVPADWVHVVSEEEIRLTAGFASQVESLIASYGSAK